MFNYLFLIQHCVGEVISTLLVTAANGNTVTVIAKPYGFHFPIDP